MVHPGSKDSQSSFSAEGIIAGQDDGRVFADECVEGDCEKGKGTMVFSTGHKYTGNYQDGVRHGEGVLLLPGGPTQGEAVIGL